MIIELFDPFGALIGKADIIWSPMTGADAGDALMQTVNLPQELELSCKHPRMAYRLVVKR